MQIVLYTRVSEPEDRRSTIPDRPNPKFAQIRSVRKRVNFNPRRASRPVKANADGLHYMCKACQTASKTVSVHAFIRNLFSNAKRRANEHDTPFDMEVEDWFAIYDAQGGKCALSGIEMTFTYDKNHPTFNAGAKKKNGLSTSARIRSTPGRGMSKAMYSFCARK